MITYDLHLLGWHAFQHLCLTICRDILGQTVVSFLDSNDAGKDGAFTGTWQQKGAEDLSGQFVIQCKFSNRVGHKLQLSEVEEEFDKISKLVNAGQCDCYVLITNAGITGRFETSFKKRLAGLGVRQSLILGSTWIFAQISENKHLRMSVPRVYGLGDLSQILDERAYAQSRQLLASMREDMAKIVMTTAYHKAAKALSDHGFVLIIGEAAAGKTTIASMLAMAAIDQWGLSTVKLDSPEQLNIHWNPEDPTQFFWIDDAFGMTQYESILVTNWNHKLVQVRSMLQQGIKIVMTSRDYIYRRARADLKEGAFPLFNESQVVIDVQDLLSSEKEQILYNHLKLGTQPLAFIRDVKPFLQAVAAHERFIPETARRLADPAFTNGLQLWELLVLDFVDKQEGHLKDVIRNLDKDSQAALALIYMNNGQLNSPLVLASDEAAAIVRLGSTTGGCIEALEAMHNSLVQFTVIDDAAIWRFKHPTISDAYAAIIADSPEQLETYLQGTDLAKVFEQVTCGDVALEKALIVPKSMFPVMLERLAAFRRSATYKSRVLTQWDAQRRVLIFLARRSSREFIRQYLERNPDLFEVILKPSISFYYSTEIEMVIKLHAEGLLPEEHRKAFADYIISFTESGEDLYLLKDEDLQTVFTEAELAAVREQVRENLLPQLDQLRRKREGEFREYNHDTSEEHMEEFFDRMNILLEVFGEEPALSKKVEAEIFRAKDWVEENNFDAHAVRPERMLSSAEAPLTTTTTRNIFDDIDVK
jgi:energy-coupling factor transporter ATP-binding protein EcfA2